MDGKHQTPISAILIPLGQSLVSGALLGAVATAAGHVWEWRQPWAIGALVAAGVSALTWLSLLQEWRRFLAGVLGVELVQPDNQPVVIVSDDNGRQGARIADLWQHVDESRLIEMCDRIYNGQSFTMANFAGTNKMFSRGEFEALRSLLMARGLVRWRIQGSHNHGTTWTPGGRALVRHYAQQSPTLPNLQRVSRDNNQ